MAAEAIGGVTVRTMTGAEPGFGEGVDMAKKEQHEVRGGCKLEKECK